MLNTVTTIAVIALGLLAALTFFLKITSRNHTRKMDRSSPEYKAELIRRKNTIYAVVNYVLLFLFAGITAALSFHSLVGFGRTNLNLHGGWEYLVPCALDGAGMFFAVMAIRQATSGETAVGARFLVWVFSGSSAWFNWVNAPSGEEHYGAAPFFAGMSIAAALLFDRALKMTLKDSLKAQGLIPTPLPRISLQRWVFSPLTSTRAKFRIVKHIDPEMDPRLREVFEGIREEKLAKQREKIAKQEKKEISKELAKLDREQAAPSRGRKKLGKGRSIPELPAGSNTATANVTGASKMRDQIVSNHSGSSAEELKAKLDQVSQPASSLNGIAPSIPSGVSPEESSLLEFANGISFDNLDEQVAKLTS